MSHNNTKVNSQSPDVSGNITLAVSNLVSGTPSQNDTIKYNGSSWEVTTLSSDVSFLYITTSTPNSYSNSNASSTTSGSWYFYGDNIVNNIGATINKQSGTDWVTSITLPAGNYVIRSSTLAEFSATGYLRLQWEIKSSQTPISNVSIVGDNFTTYGGSSSTCLGYASISSSTEIDCNIKGTSNIDTVSNQGNTPSEYNYILILKV